ncbi:MAG: hypothetical protein EXX96DRAFT_611614 [Benjaminiella poitrasii]|nr:MAG: hypothetical protein EXX96DRAFT_611614 [Benjaminiella poitrasii]
MTVSLSDVMNLITEGRKDHSSPFTKEERSHIIIEGKRISVASYISHDFSQLLDNRQGTIGLSSILLQAGAVHEDSKNLFSRGEFNNFVLANRSSIGIGNREFSNEILLDLWNTPLCARYLWTAFQLFFDDRSDEGDDTTFEFTDGNNGESKYDCSITKKRPDGVISKTDKSIDFVKVKPLCKTTCHSKVKIDLYRLAIFSKNTIDIHKLKCALTIQAIGSSATSYLVQKASLFLMTELDRIKMPMSISELFSSTPIIVRLFNVLNFFEEH